MPHVVVKLLAGRSEEQKSQLAAQLVKDVMAILPSRSRR
jgi:phenylpyruvate tautomerase PptA (4-oxalocrotonate tautomerase family)